jgi:ABC-2 type transport system ATP-binding protein
VEAVSFSISPGDVLGYLGPNGSGKSTTVKMLTGLLEPTSGEILFHGRPVRDDLIAYKQAIGYVPEEAQLYGFLTGWEYLELIATLRNIPVRVFEAKANAMLEAFSIHPYRDATISSYSKGMRQRIALISATIHNPGSAHPGRAVYGAGCVERYRAAAGDRTARGGGEGHLLCEPGD